MNAPVRDTAAIPTGTPPPAEPSEGHLKDTLKTIQVFCWALAAVGMASYISLLTRPPHTISNLYYAAIVAWVLEIGVAIYGGAVRTERNSKLAATDWLQRQLRTRVPASELGLFLLIVALAVTGAAYLTQAGAS